MSCVLFATLLAAYSRCYSWKVASALRIHIMGTRLPHSRYSGSVSFLPFPLLNKRPAACPRHLRAGRGWLIVWTKSHHMALNLHRICILLCTNLSWKMWWAIASPRWKRWDSVFETWSPHSPTLCQGSSRINWHLPSPSGHLKSIVINV